MHYQLTNTQFLVGGFIFALLLIFALAALLERHSKKPAPFKNYFFCEYDDDLRQSSWSEDEDGMQHHRSRFTPLRLRDFEANEHRTRVPGSAQRDRESN
jgi:hypothetical protein